VVVVSFEVFTCIVVVAATVVGGVGNIPGAYIGALIVSGGVVTQLLSGLATQINEYLPLAGGIVLVLNLMFSPDGLFEMSRRSNAKIAEVVLRRIGRTPRTRRQSKVVLSEPGHSIRVPQLGLQVKNVKVSFGGVDALRNVSLEVHPGEVHGLIGPNGAGKTTLIDAVTGFVRTRSGEIIIGDLAVTGWSPQRRAVMVRCRERIKNMSRDQP